MASAGADQIGAFVGYGRDRRQLRARLGALCLGLLALPAVRHPAAQGVLVHAAAACASPSAWLEILGLLVATKATGGESSDTIYAVLGGSGAIIAALAMVAIAIGTIAVNAMNDYTGSLSLQAAGVRIKRVYSAAAVAVLGFLFTLYLQYNGDFSANFINFLLFISYWISPFVGVVLADWWLRGRQADARSIVDFARLPSGTVALVALVVGFVGRHPVPELGARLRVGRPVQLDHRQLPARRRPGVLRRRRGGLPDLLVRGTVVGAANLT